MTNTFPVLHCILSNPVTAPSPQFFHRLAPHFPYILISFILSIIIKMGSCASQLINEELILLGTSPVIQNIITSEILE